MMMTRERTCLRAAPYAPAPAYEAVPVLRTCSFRAEPLWNQRSRKRPAYQPEIHDSFADTQEITYAAVADPEPELESAPAIRIIRVRSVTPGDLSPEMIDAIARRAVELMSDKVIREIAWEVVPDLAELLIKKQLEETK